MHRRLENHKIFFLVTQSSIRKILIGCVITAPEKTSRKKIIDMPTTNGNYNGIFSRCLGPLQCYHTIFLSNERVFVPSLLHIPSPSMQTDSCHTSGFYLTGHQKQRRITIYSAKIYVWTSDSVRKFSAPSSETLVLREHICDHHSVIIIKIGFSLHDFADILSQLLFICPVEQRHNTWEINLPNHSFSWIKTWKELDFIHKPKIFSHLAALCVVVLLLFPNDEHMWQMECVKFIAGNS